MRTSDDFLLQHVSGRILAERACRGHSGRVSTPLAPCGTATRLPWGAPDAGCGAANNAAWPFRPPTIPSDGAEPSSVNGIATVTPRDPNGRPVIIRIPDGSMANGHYNDGRGVYPDQRRRPPQPGRMAGLTAEVAEEHGGEKPMRVRIPVEYDGEPPREMR